MPNESITGDALSSDAALAGVRILDLSHVFQGPVATQLLADFGADVIKVERPGAGDWSRVWGPFVDGVSMPFACLNRNKRSIALDLKSPEGIAITHALISTADVLVHNFRGGVMEKLELGYDALSSKYPRLIYASSSGWGDEGPYVQQGRGGHDMMARAEAGWFVHAGTDRQPIPGGMSVDYPAGLMLANAILMALFARERSGRGQRVTTDLYSVALHGHVWTGAHLLNLDREQTGGGAGDMEDAIDRSFPTADGWIEVSPVFSSNPLRDISIGMGIGDLSENPRYNSPQLQLARRDEINARLTEHFRNKTTDEWMTQLSAAGVLCARINTLDQVIDDPQVQANHMAVLMDFADAGSIHVLGTPMRLYGTPAVHDASPPYLGEHTSELLTELGYSRAQIDDLIVRGIVEEKHEW
jgi:crotonobetainyl-CoA:carnitine CoA-transferase CaiB-like acyl-CoA transferase